MPGPRTSTPDQMYCGPAFIEAHSTLEAKLKMRVAGLHLPHAEQMLSRPMGPWVPASLRTLVSQASPKTILLTPGWRQDLCGSRVGNASMLPAEAQEWAEETSGSRWGLLGEAGEHEPFCVAGSASWKVQDMKLEA